MDPSLAEACSWGSCGESWSRIIPRTGDTLPRDGALVFSGGSVGSCVDDLWAHVDIDVRRGRQRIAGKIDMIGGTGLLVFRPDEPWRGGERYDVRVVIDNEGIGGEASFLRGQEECDSPAEVEFSFTAADVSPALAAPPPPSNRGQTTIVTDFEFLACCSGVIPTDDGTAGCDWEVTWPQPGDCAYLYEETYVYIDAELPAPPALLEGQVLHQLVVDGAPVHRAVDSGWLWGSRAAPACAWVESIHLGNGETRRSTEVCTPAEVAPTLGVHLRDVAAELQCDVPVLCGSDNYEWSTLDCTPFDPESPPLLELPSRTATIETDCVAIEADGGVEPRSCACSSASTTPPLFSVLVLIALGRRRRRWSRGPVSGGR
jgi:MYXO-CTERM domain-containing protein